MDKHITGIDYFISYRRDAGGIVAALINKALIDNGIFGFFDAKSLEHGDYENDIESNIKKARNVIVIVSQDTFKSEWVLKEMALAIKLKKSIIPIFIDGLNTFPKNVPSNLVGIEKYNGIILSYNNIDDSISKLVGWCSTRIDLLLRKAFFGTIEAKKLAKETDEYKDAVLDNLASVWKQMIQNLSVTKRNYFLNKMLEDIKTALEKNKNIGELVFSTFNLVYLKYILDETTIEINGSLYCINYEGFRSNIFENINNFVNCNRLSPDAFFLVEASKDRDFYTLEDENLNQLKDALVKLFKYRYRAVHTQNDFINEIADLELQKVIRVKNLTQFEDIIKEIVDFKDVKDFNSLVELFKFQKADVEEIISRLKLSPKSTKTLSVQLINDYVNYKGEFER